MKSVDKRKRIGHYIAAVILAGVFVVLDQITKYLASACLKGQNPVVIAEGVFELHYLENRGAAFGLFQNQQFFILGAHNHIHINSPFPHPLYLRINRGSADTSGDK